MFADDLAFGQNAALRLLRFEREITLDCDIDFVRPRWSGQVFLSIEGNESSAPVVCVAGRDGRALRRSFEIPGAGYISIADATANEQGDLALIGYARHSDDSLANFVARLPADPSESVITRTTPYVPSKVAFAPNGTIWTVGWVRDQAGYALRENVLKVFDLAGKVTKTIVPSGMTFQPNAISKTNSANHAMLRASLDRIVLLTPGNQYFEFSPDGRELSRIAGPPLTEDHVQLVNLAISNKNSVVISSGNQKKRSVDLWMLDRSRLVWTSLTADDGSDLKLMEVVGFDGDSLVAALGFRLAKTYSLALKPSPE